MAQTIAAFSAVSDNSTKKTAKPQVSSKYQASDSSSDIPDETLSAELLEGRTNRDVVRKRGKDLISPYNEENTGTCQFGGSFYVQPNSQN